MFFELEDIKRRHTPYYDIYNTGTWIATPDYSLSWNYQRGAIAGLTAALINETQVLYQQCWKLMLTQYEAPRNLKQLSIFARETFRMENFRKGLKSRLQYAAVFGGVDIASRVAMFRACNAGFYRTFGSFEVPFIHKIPTSIVAALTTSWVGVPFEMAKLAYYADRTFPKELQRGYTSYFNALFRIPFEEGPYFLFKNTFPFILRNSVQTMTLFYTYDFLKDKLGFTYRILEFPYASVKAVAAAFAVYLACVFSYPWGNTVREMVDFWPKEKGGVCTFDNNYRKAAVWLYYHEYGSNYFPGFANNYFWRNAPWMFLTLWVADNLGIFNYWCHDYFAAGGTNSWEDTFI